MAFTELDELIAWEIQDKWIPSISYAVFDAREVLAQRYLAFGGGTLPDDSVFRIGSISKTFAAILAMQQVEAGRLELDEDVSAEHLRGFTPANPFGSDPITLRKLLSHRAGLTREAPVGHYLDDSGAPIWATIAALSRTTLKAPADGSAYFYSNAGFAVVGGLVEVATGRRYDEALQAGILDRLGLNDTAIALTPEIRKRLAPAKMWTIAADTPAPVFDLGSAPAGNVFATLDDLVRYAQALLRGGDELLTPASLELMWTAAGPNPAKGYGLGFSVDALDGQRMVGHGGVVYGYASTLQLLPAAGLGVIVFSTLDVTNDIIGRIARHALRLALAGRGLGHHPARPRQLRPAGADVAARLAGVYGAGDNGPTIELRAHADHLLLVDQEVPYELRPTGLDAFVLDGRLIGEGSAYPHLELQVDRGALRWAGRLWHRVDGPLIETAPADLAAQLGSYGPDFLPARLFINDGKLICLMELFFPHECEPLGGNRYRMRGGMYAEETLTLGLSDAAGRPAIKVGETLLTRRDGR